MGKNVIIYGGEFTQGSVRSHAFAKQMLQSMLNMINCKFYPSLAQDEELYNVLNLKLTTGFLPHSYPFTIISANF